jgi:hypothetical protein
MHLAICMAFAWHVGNLAYMHACVHGHATCDMGARNSTHDDASWEGLGILFCVRGEQAGRSQWIPPHRTHPHVHPAVDMAPPKGGSEASAVEVTSAVIFYCLCSGGMLLVNKLTVHHIPLPGLITTCQFSACSIFVYGGKMFGCLTMDDFVWEKAKYFLIYVLSFTIGTYANMKVLSMANVETVIVFRSCTPMAIAVFDSYFYNRAWPSPRSVLSLLLITAGAVAYILNDREFAVKGMSAYYWVSFWWFVLIFQLTYGERAPSEWFLPP